jgi:multisubunit Na+/H+ antiporter MnhE subunit
VVKSSPNAKPQTVGVNVFVTLLIQQTTHKQTLYSVNLRRIILLIAVFLRRIVVTKDLIDKGILRQDQQGGRSTNYELADSLK